MPRLAHHVFFQLHEPTDANVQKLVDSCKKYLADHDGVVDFSVGRREPGLDRPVNDANYDVSLHVIFSDRASHDVYQAAPRHLEFIALEKPTWKSVRVFDSNLE